MQKLAPKRHPRRNSKVVDLRQVKKEKRRKRSKKGFLQRLFAKIRLLIFCYILATIVLPQSCSTLWKNLVLNRWHNNEVEYVSYNYIDTDKKLLTSNTFSNKVQFTPLPSHSMMDELYEGGTMNSLNRKLVNLSKHYSKITPHVFVWDYATGANAGMNIEKSIPTASIIKIPILYELFRKIDKGLINYEDEMILEPNYVTSGSGYLQYNQRYQSIKIKNLAKLMIQESDNTATNMLLGKIGGMNTINRVMRQWGVEHIQMNNWLPDLKGTNIATVKDMAKLLYNIDNPELLSLSSRSKIIDIMSHVKNVYLIRAGIARNAQFIHKTGDIGKMLGDAGIVKMPNGRKYIVVIMVKRPHNSLQAKDFIIKASRTIYNHLAVN